MRNIELLEQFLFALSMKERYFGAFNYWNVRASGLLCGPERKYRGGIDPLIAADRGDAEQIDLRRSEQHQQREEVGSLRAGAVLVGNVTLIFLCAVAACCSAAPASIVKITRIAATNIKKRFILASSLRAAVVEQRHP